jgi:RNA polymerase sigma-70 factor, ECF subfamily
VQNTSAKRELEDLCEGKLVELARRNNPDAIRMIMQRYNRRLYRVARGILGSDTEAEDVLQDTYLRAFTNLGRFRGESSLSTWLTRIAINEALGRKRRTRPSVDISALEAQQSTPGQVIQFPMMHEELDPERTVAQREIRRFLEHAIDDLPEAFRSVFVLRVVEGLSLEETSELLETRPETVKTRLHRARQLLKKAMDDELMSALSDAFPFAGARCRQLTESVLRQLAGSGR